MLKCNPMINWSGSLSSMILAISGQYVSFCQCIPLPDRLTFNKLIYSNLFYENPLACNILGVIF